MIKGPKDSKNLSIFFPANYYNDLGSVKFNSSVVCSLTTLEINSPLKERNSVHYIIKKNLEDINQEANNSYCEEYKFISNNVNFNDNKIKGINEKKANSLNNTLKKEFMESPKVQLIDFDNN